MNNLASTAIGYAGSKDRQAVTTQFITSPKPLTSNDDLLLLRHVGFSDEPLRLGDLAGNFFVIRVEGVRRKQEVHIPNYFGNQRFSSENVEVGLMLLRKEYKKVAVHLREQYKEIRSHLDATPTDYIGALKRAPLHSLLMYIHSVQSLLFNEAVIAYIKDTYQEYEESTYRHGAFLFPTSPLPEINVPIPGAAQDLGEWERYYAPALRALKLSPSQFYIRSIPQLTQEGTTRSLAMTISDLSVTALEENVFEARMRLGVGSYATVALRSLFED